MRRLRPRRRVGDHHHGDAVYWSRVSQRHTDRAVGYARRARVLAIVAAAAALLVIAFLVGRVIV